MYKYDKIRLMKEDGNALDFDPLALASEIEATTERIVNFHGNLAGRALSAVDHATVMEATQRLNEAAQALESTVERTVILEEFGGEESYYTVWRLFCAGDHPGTAYTIEEIYDHLAKNYDMSGVSLEALVQDMVDWTKDINDDAKKAEIPGRFISLDDDVFVFAVSGNTIPSSAVIEPEPVEERKDAEAEVEIAEEKDQPAEAESDIETKRELNPAEQTILVWFDEQLRVKKSLKKPYTVKELSSLFNIDKDETLNIIDSLVERGMLFKLKTNPSHAPVLVRELPEETAEVSDAEYAKKEVAKLRLTPELATEIVRVILDRVQTQQQKVATGNIYTELLESGAVNKDVIITELNRLMRQMESMGVLVIGTGKSRRREVMQVGISSQEVKDILTSALRQGRLEKVIADYLSASDQIDKN